MILFFEFLTEPLVILSHLLPLKLFPLKINFLFEILFLHHGGLLNGLFGSDIAHEHFTVKSLDHILIIVEHLICFVDLLLAELLLVGFLLSIYSSSLNLIIFKLLNSLIFFSFPLGLNSVWPLMDSAQ